MILAVFKQEGMLVCDREMWKILVKTPVRWPAQDWSTLFGTPSGPEAFPGLENLSTRLTSRSCNVSVHMS